MCSWWRSRWNSSVNWKGLKISAWTDHFWRRTNGEHHQENVLHWQHFKFSAFKKKIPPQDSAFLNCNSLELWLLPLTLLVCYYSSTLFHPRFLLLPASSSHPSHPLFFFPLSSSTLKRSQPAGIMQWSPLDNSARTKLTGSLQSLTNQIAIFTSYVYMTYTNFSVHYFQAKRESSAQNKLFRTRRFSKTCHFV